MKVIEIRPKEMLDRYVELSAQDAKQYFKQDNRSRIPCVACGSENHIFEFAKSDFLYDKCEDCNTLYQTPRPTIDQFEEFYRNSKSSQYWAEVFFPAVAENRREKIFRPRVDRLSELMKKRGISVNKIVDVGAGYGIFLEEWKIQYPNCEAVAIEPSKLLANECRNKNLRVEENIAENVTSLDGFGDLVVCFEVLEHVYDPLAFINILKNMACPGGYVFISTLCIDGFDLQLLWEKSTQISPPHHINFHSVKGFEKLFERAGLTDFEVYTPGQLDVDIVRNAYINDSNILQENKFIKSILKNEKLAANFQSFLVDNKLSSHAWVLGKR